MEISIDGRKVGGDNPCYTIAEAGANHDGSVEGALRLIDAAVGAKADSIKFQTYKADRLATRTAPKYWDDGKAGESQFDVFSRLDSISGDQWREIFEYAAKRQITCFSTPFDEESADLLYDLQVPAFKIASADITHIPLIRHVASKGLPIFISTGMASEQEIDEALAAMQDRGNHDVIMLHCVTSYPTRPEDASLETIRTIAGRHPDHVVGYSDHTLGINVAICSVAYGAKVLEKHFTYDNSLEQSPDHRLSLNAWAFARMVDGIREAEAAGGSGTIGKRAAESEAVRLARRSVVSSQRIPRGATIRKEMVSVKRPAVGIYPKFMDEVIGSVAARDIEEDVPIQWEDIGR